MYFLLQLKPIIKFTIKYIFNWFKTQYKIHLILEFLYIFFTSIWIYFVFVVIHLINAKKIKFGHWILENSAINI